MAKSKIEWTESVWNPVTGCTKVSEGCENCYAAKMAKRLKCMGSEKYANGFEVALHESCLEDPLRMKKPQMIFVNSMSDLFHEKVPLGYVKKIFSVMKKANWHTFQILTKRAERLSEACGELDWPENVWMGVTVESKKRIDRIARLKETPAKIKFVSFEPLLNDVGNIDVTGIDWAIVGGESGIGSRPMEESWVLGIKEQCERQGISFYFKQWGGRNKKKNGRLLSGRTWDEMPKVFGLVS